jgi:hypothetical protein
VLYECYQCICIEKGEQPFPFFYLPNIKCFFTDKQSAAINQTENPPLLMPAYAGAKM